MSIWELIACFGVGAGMAVVIGMIFSWLFDDL